MFHLWNIIFAGSHMNQLEVHDLADRLEIVNGSMNACFINKFVLSHLLRFTDFRMLNDAIVGHFTWIPYSDFFAQKPLECIVFEKWYTNFK